MECMDDVWGAVQTTLPCGSNSWRHLLYCNTPQVRARNHVSESLNPWDSQRKRNFKIMCSLHHPKWVFPKIGVPQNGWFIMEHPIKMDDLGVPLFLETPKFNDQVLVVQDWWQTAI